ncbi:putative integral membrane protein [Lasiodiplodia theobromae]|nr:putative integral membrane protein [Lasiodiplodia theobromae]
MSLSTLQPLCYWTITPLFAIATITTVARTYIRLFIKSFGLDDWASITLLFFNAGLQAILYVFLKYGAGLHIVKVQTEHPDYITRLLKGLFAIEIYYIWMHFYLKMGFLLFYMRLSHVPSFRILIYMTMVGNALCTVGIWLLYCLQCIPLEAFWNPAKYPDTICLNSSVTYFVPYSLMLSLDIVIFIIPIHTVWKLQMTLRRKLQVLSVICTGGAAVLVSALRLVVLLEFSRSPDFTWTLGKMIIISSFEINVAIIASNMPSMKALWTSWRDGTLSSQQSKYSQHHQLSDIPSSGQQSRSASKTRGWPDPTAKANNVSEQSLVTKDRVAVTHSPHQDTHDYPLQHPED